MTPIGDVHQRTFRPDQDYAIAWVSVHTWSVDSTHRGVTLLLHMSCVWVATTQLLGIELRLFGKARRV